MRALTYITTTLGATAIGITLGIFLALSKGSKTRIEISGNNHGCADTMQGSFDDISDSASQSFESIENETKRLSKKGKARVKKMVADLNDKIQ
jgi:gas vesicle protein